MTRGQEILNVSKPRPKFQQLNFYMCLCFEYMHECVCLPVCQVEETLKRWKRAWDIKQGVNKNFCRDCLELYVIRWQTGGSQQHSSVCVRCSLAYRNSQCKYDSNTIISIHRETERQRERKSFSFQQPLWSLRCQRRTAQLLKDILLYKIFTGSAQEPASVSVLSVFMIYCQVLQCTANVLTRFYLPRKRRSSEMTISRKPTRIFSQYMSTTLGRDGWL